MPKKYRSLLRASVLSSGLAVLVPTAPANAIGLAQQYAVDFTLNAGATVNTIQVSVDYRKTKGAFRGNGTSVQCSENKDLSATFAFNHCDPGAENGCRDESRLNAAMISSQPITGPVVLFTCIFEAADAAPLPDGFHVSVVDSGVNIAGRVSAQSAAVAVASIQRVEGEVK